MRRGYIRGGWEGLGLSRKDDSDIAPFDCLRLFKYKGLDIKVHVPTGPGPSYMNQLPRERCVATAKVPQ